MVHSAACRPAGALRRLLGVSLALALLLPVPALSQSEMVIHTEGTKLYHRAACPDLKGAKGVLAMTRAQAEARGFKPHEACDPANPDRPGAKPEAPPTVYLDGSRYYHRAKCSTLPADKDKIKSASLEVAGKSHWPCPTCKPPIRRRSEEPAVPGMDRRGR
jgi:hypothetical protein